jgi:type IV secretion system protein VirB6
VFREVRISKMNQQAPITWLIAVINELLADAIAGAASKLVAYILPPLGIFFGIYIVLLSLNYLRGGSAEGIVDVFKRFFAFTLILGLGMNANNYVNIVLPIVIGIGPNIADAVSGGNSGAGALDELALNYVNILSEGYEQANTPIFPLNLGTLLLYGIKVLLVLGGLVPFLVAATLSYIAADVGSQLVAAIGPLFFAFLVFPATRQYFSAWLNSAISFALVPILISILTGISISISKKAFGEQASLGDTTLVTVFLGAVVNLVLVFLVRECVGLAGKLSGGGASFATGGLGGFANAARTAGQGSARDARAISEGISSAKKLAQKLKPSRKNTAKEIS